MGRLIDGVWSDEWYDTKSSGGGGRSVQQRFEEQVERTPDEPAVAFEDKRDTALGKLAEYVDVQTFTRSTGEVVVFTTEGTLLDAFPNFLSHQPLTVMAPGVSHANGYIYCMLVI